MTSTPTDRLEMMESVREGMLTLGEAAYLLGIDMEQLLELVYSRQVPAKVVRESGRMLLDEAEIQRLRNRQSTQPAG
jgi:predicted HTH domain antitoxin